MSEMKTNATMKKTKDTTDEARECVPFVPTPPMHNGALASTPRESTSRALATARATQSTANHALIASPRASPARSWQQMMRARLGIGKTKSWADWAEEDEKVAEPTTTLADAMSEVAGEALGMLLRGGGLPHHASAHGQDGGGGGALTEGLTY